MSELAPAVISAWFLPGDLYAKSMTHQNCLRRQKLRMCPMYIDLGRGGSRRAFPHPLLNGEMQDSGIYPILDRQKPAPRQVSLGSPHAPICNRSIYSPIENEPT